MSEGADTVVCKTKTRWAFLLFLAVFTGGCVTTTEYVTLVHRVVDDVARIQGAEGAVVSVKVTDRRTIKDNVAVKGMLGMWPIISRKDVPAVVEDAIEGELAARGFSIADRMAHVAVDLRKLYCVFISGTWSGRAVGEVVMYVELSDAHGTVVFSKVVTGKDVRTGVQLPSAKHARIALEQALDDAVVSLVSDQSFAEALLEVGKK